MSTPSARNASSGVGDTMGRGGGTAAESDSQSDTSGMHGGIVEIVRAWRSVLLHPSVATFDRERPCASWRAIWLSLLPVALADALGVVYAVYGPGAAAGYSSLPVGPKLHLVQTPLLPFAALFGSPLQFVVFAGLLFSSARLLGGRGDFKTQVYLMALFWAPLMVASAVVELVPIVGSGLGLLLRSYALALLVPALAAVHAFPLRRALAALLLPVACGLLLGVVVLALAWPRIQPLLTP